MALAKSVLPVRGQRMDVGRRAGNQWPPWAHVFIYLGDVHRCDAGPAARLWSGLSGIVCLGCDVFRSGGANYFVDGHGGVGPVWRHACLSVF